MKRSDRLFIVAVVAFFLALLVATTPSAQVTVIQQYAQSLWQRTGDGTAAVPSRAYINDTDTGSYRIGADNVGFSAGGTLRWDYNTSRFNLSSAYGLTFNAGSGLYDGGANVVELRNGTNAQSLLAYNTYANSGTDYERGMFSWVSNVLTIGTQSGGTGTARGMTLKPSGGGIVFNTAGSDRWSVQNGGDFLANSDNAYNIGATGGTRPKAVFIAQPSITVGSGTGVTVNDSGSVRDLVYKVTLAQTAFVCAATTCDVTIGTLPTNTRLMTIDANLSTTFACSATCTTSTLSIVVGKGSGGAEYLASFDADAATAWFGDADAEMGTLMTRAAAIQGGTLQTGGTQAIVLRLTSGTGNIGNGAATNLSQGSVTVYIATRVYQ